MAPMTTVYRTYDQAALDAQYNNRGRVPDFSDIVTRWTTDSENARATLDSQLGVSYGPSGEETLDIFHPASSAGGAPIQVFFHGGYWRSLGKDDFSYIAPAFVGAGSVCIIINYALIPTVTMDELVRQCRAALVWIHANAATFGGDADRLFVSGHSAGGHLVAMVMATMWEGFAGAPVDLVKGGVSISGIFELEPIRLCFLNETLQLMEDDVVRNSPSGMAPATKAPLVVAVGGDESEEFHRQSRDFAGSWRNQGVAAEYISCAGKNHFTIVDDFATANTPLFRTTTSQMGL